MVSVTVPVDDELKKDIERFSWVNWSDVAREELLKKEIFESYIKTGELSDEDEGFCEEMDWHPVDELELKEEFVKRLKKKSKEPAKGKAMSPEELKRWLDGL